MTLSERIGSWFRREPDGSIRVRVIVKGRIGEGWFDVDHKLALTEGATLATLIERPTARGCASRRRSRQARTCATR
jgi:hypothetical protein